MKPSIIIAAMLLCAVGHGQSVKQTGKWIFMPKKEGDNSWLYVAPDKSKPQLPPMPCGMRGQMTHEQIHPGKWLAVSLKAESTFWDTEAEAKAAVEKACAQ